MNYTELEDALHNLKPRTRLYEVLKKHLSTQGRWKAAPRGKPFTKDDKRRKLL